MSFILDALRKSDARRQQSGAPGLNSPEPPRPPRRRRRLLPGLAIALVLVAVSVTAVYLFRPDWLPLGAGESRQARAPASEPDSPQVASDTGQAEQLEPSQPPTTDTTDDAGVAAEPEQSQAQSDQSRERRRRRRVPPSEQEQVAQQGDVVQDEPPQRESAPVSAEEATKELERRMAEAASRRREAPEPRPGEREETRQPEREASPPAEEQAPESGSRESESGSEALNEEVAEYVRAWELPLSVRRSLPDLTLTIHVYSPDEAERFVLINGERHVAGDEIDGARIVDIRREGAVVDFRSHRFLLEPR